MPFNKSIALQLFFTSVLKNIVKYRETQCIKYYAEKGNEYGSSYEKLERYKNRVRVVDAFLCPCLDLINNLTDYDLICPKLTEIE